MSDDDSDDPQFRAFSIPIPAEVLHGVQEAHEKRHMRVEDTRNRVFEFLDSLTLEQLATMRYVLNYDAESAYAMNQYLDGQIVTLLRRVHNVDPDYPLEDPTKDEL